jgi:UDP-glucose 4-epimerase
MRPDLAISIFTKSAIEGKPLNIFGDGSKTRDFTYIDDIVKANNIALTAGVGEYNIGGGHKISISQLAEKIITITKSTSEVRFFPDKIGDADHTLANTEKAQRELGWIPETTVDGGLRRYAEWVQKSV